MAKLRLIELFAGGGGVAAGAVEAGIEPVAAVEYDPENPELSSAIADCHERNFPNCKMIRKTVEQCLMDGFKDLPECDILWASPTCKNYSAANSKKESTEDIHRAMDVGEALAALKPQYFYLENVPNYFESKALDSVLDILRILRYSVSFGIFDLSDYGIPQSRKRLILIAAKGGATPAMPPKADKIGWYEAIADLVSDLEEAELLKAQRDHLDSIDRTQSLWLPRVGRGKGRSTPGNEPAPTFLKGMFTDQKNASRSHFANIVLPSGIIKKVSIECVKRLQTFPDWYELPDKVAIAGSILGYSVPPLFAQQLFEQVHIRMERNERLPQIYAKEIAELERKKKQKKTLTREQQLKAWTFSVFESLSPDQSYHLAYSGGKDSHVLLGLYLQWLREKGIEPLKNIRVIFADTDLESRQIYDLVEKVEELCERIGIEFLRARHELEKNYWVIQFGRGYPVPDFRVRWCTSYLKIKPMEKISKGSIAIAGSHVGESKQRNKRLNSCGSTECGIDKISNKIEPIARWENCDVWDWILTQGDEALYPGFSELISETYDISSSTTGLRMGCFHCPVIAASTTAKNREAGIIPEYSEQIRLILDSLRTSPRITSPRTKKNGAILIDARIAHWKKIKPYFPQLRKDGYINDEIINMVDELLRDRSYPKTYNREWIKKQESLLVKN